jgi:hypothetical protein
VIKYRIDRVSLGQPLSRQTAWAFAQTTTRGTEFTYRVVDHNHAMRNRWEFVVRVPDAPTSRIEVRPQKVPNDNAFAGLDRMALTFMRGTRSGYTPFRYCQLSLAKATGEGTRDVVHRGEKKLLPYWLRQLGWRLKQKATVRNTRGTDAHALVVLVRPEDHEMMVSLFLASKAWICKRGISLDE